MTAATLDSNKSKAKSLLGKIKKYEERIIDDIYSIEIFPNNPSLNRCVQLFCLLEYFLILLFFLSPPIVGFILASVSRFAYYFESNEIMRSWITSDLKKNKTFSCTAEEADHHEELQYREYIMMLTEVVKIVWISSLIIIYILPEFINSFVCFKRARKDPSAGQFFSVFIPETFYTIGIALMTFEVLPKLNFNYCGLFLIWCVIEWGLHTPISMICETEKIRLKNLLILVDIVCLGIFIYVTIFNPFDGINRNNSDCWVAILALALLNAGFWRNVPKTIFSFTRNLPPLINAREKVKPVRDSIYAWVSLWNIIVFLASSYTIYVINEGNTTQLFEMFEPALSLHNVTDIPLQQIDFNATQYDNELITYTKTSLYPVIVLAFQVEMAVFINMRTSQIYWDGFKVFTARSRWGPSVPLVVSIAFFMYSEYYRSLKNYLFYHICLSEQLKNLFSEIRVPDVVFKVFSIHYPVNWEAHLLIISLLWIVFHSIDRSSKNENSKEDNEAKNPEIETPPIVEVHVISKNETADEEKENLNVD